MTPTQRKSQLNAYGITNYGDSALNLITVIPHSETAQAGAERRGIKCTVTVIFGNKKKKIGKSKMIYLYLLSLILAIVVYVCTRRLSSRMRIAVAIFVFLTLSVALTAMIIVVGDRAAPGDVTVESLN